MHVTLVGAPSVAVHPVAVYVASLAIAVTRRKGCDASHTQPAHVCAVVPFSPYPYKLSPTPPLSFLQTPYQLSPDPPLLFSIQLPTFSNLPLFSIPPPSFLQPLHPLPSPPQLTSIPTSLRGAGCDDDAPSPRAHHLYTCSLCPVLVQLAPCPCPFSAQHIHQSFLHPYAMQCKFYLRWWWLLKVLI